MNDQMILRYKKDGLLTIEPFDLSLLQPTHYYFRLGRYVKVWDKERREYDVKDIGQRGRETLEIPPRGYALIVSFELLACSEKVLAIFGQRSNVALSGLRLNHSPTIDPGFPGHLEMGIENLLNKPTKMKYRHIIGKALYFDISDTYPVKDGKGTMIEQVFRRRETLREPEPPDEW